jgi:phage replication-related protein YjqB (UPF0714/DUF867 family)
MTDEFQNYEKLSEVMTEGIDFKIKSRDAGPETALVIAPHGGKIEPGSSEIASHIAGDEYRFYSFEGLRSAKNRRLHITSTNFDEPVAMSMLRQATFVVAIHGCQDDEGRCEVYLGGLDIDLSSAIGQQLELEGFSTRKSGHRFPGAGTTNICNRGRSHAGAQLEIPHTLRMHLIHRENRDDLDAFARAVKAAMNAHL